MGASHSSGWQLAVFTLMVFHGSGCSRWWITDFETRGKNVEPIPIERVSLGASKAEVRRALGPPFRVLGAKRTASGTVEVWGYEYWIVQPGRDRFGGTYRFYFLNDELAEWQQSQEPLSAVSTQPDLLDLWIQERIIKQPARIRCQGTGSRTVDCQEY